jgi:hypothetical protein
MLHYLWVHRNDRKIRPAAALCRDLHLLLLQGIEVGELQKGLVQRVLLQLHRKQALHATTTALNVPLRLASTTASPCVSWASLHVSHSS